ncbi:hypothetical protein T310_8923, partial [Rasamsonia emersonii CBS 393.64]
YPSDVRRRRHLPLAAALGALPHHRRRHSGRRARPLDRRLAGLPALLPRVDVRLAAGLQPDGEELDPAPLCRPRCPGKGPGETRQVGRAAGANELISGRTLADEDGLIDGPVSLVYYGLVFGLVLFT